jgi:hypothetical protein
LQLKRNSLCELNGKIPACTSAAFQQINLLLLISSFCNDKVPSKKNFKLKNYFAERDEGEEKWEKIVCLLKVNNFVGGEIKKESIHEDS